MLDHVHGKGRFTHRGTRRHNDEVRFLPTRGHAIKVYKARRLTGERTLGLA
jgi:hypothetical protein